MTDPSRQTVRIRNPILPGFHADPSAIRVGEEYYVVASSFNWWPGIPLYHSRDLKNWTLKGSLLDRREQLDLRGNPESGGVWAPQISYNEETSLFYLVYTDVKTLSGSFFDLNNYAVTAPSVEGPWSDPVYLNSSGFDPSLFHDDDGRSWLLNLAWEFRQDYPHPGPIILQELDLRDLSLKGEPRVLYRGDPRFGCTEGPHLYKREGLYYLLTAEGGTGYGHAVKIARSETLQGPYEACPSGPLLTSRMNPDPPLAGPDPDFLKPRFYNPRLGLQKAGHGSLMETSRGETVLFHLCARPVMPQQRCVLNRETALQKVLWRDGWPVLAENPPFPSEEVTFRLQEGPPLDGTSPGRVVFGQAGLPPQFCSLRDRTDESWCSLARRPGRLSLRGRNSLYSAHDSSLVARRVQHFDCDMTVHMDFRPETYRQMAGLVLLTGSRTFYYLRYYFSASLETPCLGLMISLNGDKREEGRIPVDFGGPFSLRASLRTAILGFSYSRDGEEFLPAGAPLDATVLSDEFTNNGPGAFDGTFVGMAVQDLDRRTGWAEFLSFDYRPVPGEDSP